MSAKSKTDKSMVTVQLAPGDPAELRALALDLGHLNPTNPTADGNLSALLRALATWRRADRTGQRAALQPAAATPRPEGTP